MSTSSQGSLGRRIGAARRARPSRSQSNNKFPLVSRYDAYTYALRAAYLWHLLQPKARRLQHLPPPQRPSLTRQTTSVAQLVQDAFMGRDTKSTRFPSNFMSALDKRLVNIVIGKEKLPEFSDASVKRSFALFLNEFKRPEFRKAADKDRRMGELLLMFYSRAEKELRTTSKGPDDDSWKLMVDRHVALFVRLTRAILKDNDWAKDRPELTAQLQALETKLLAHDQDLATASQRNGGAGGTSMEVEVPRSAMVKDMPMVQTVATIFGKDLSQIQMDIDDQKDLWTEKAALQDLKMYQTSLSLNSRRTLRAEDFEAEFAYETWRKAEMHDLSQMIIAIIQSNSDLAKSAPGLASQSHSSTSNGLSNGGSLSPRHSRPSRDLSDLSRLDINQDMPVSPTVAELDNEEPFMFIPPDPGAYYRQVLKEAFFNGPDQEPVSPVNGTGFIQSNPSGLFAIKTVELLNELGMRWRVPLISRITLVKDVARELLNEQAIDFDTLDAALVFCKDPPVDRKILDAAHLDDSSYWPIADYVRNQQAIMAIHDNLMRDLFQQMLHCYGAKPPDIGPILTVLETHIEVDPAFSRSQDELEHFTSALDIALVEKAQEVYGKIASDELPEDEEDLELGHIMQLGKAILKQVDRFQKRYRKIPPVKGLMPATIFIRVALPAYAADAKDLISFVLEKSQTRGEEIPVQDGFDCYREMVVMRGLHHDVLPGVEFNFHIEELLAPFVWRWIATTEEKIQEWVEAAVRQDNFSVRSKDSAEPAAEDERHSVSIIDIFRSFNQSIDQIKELEWGDEYQHAKFMTALSKAVGAGLTKYCDQVEKFFTQEMDRTIPEQETPTTQTKQEKWMQIARDAISAKEKIEPFQFLTESFVKLNNIEWAMLQFDKIEKELNVDACAAAIQKRESPQAPRPKNEKSVFTIKIIEAEDLKACDANGLSDPYVVLGDGQRGRLAKTRVIYGNLNPRWEEAFDIVTTGPLTITVTVWDWDVMGDHDCAGRQTIKLDPVHYKDFLPRDQWIELDTQGRLLVRISMEGEKDDIRYYFGKAFRTLKRTEREMTRKITDKLSTYIHHCLSKRTLRNLTTRGTISAVSNYFQRKGLQIQPTTQPVAEADIENALKPLFTYFNDNFAIMNRTLTQTSMVMVMTRLWKETLSTLEVLLVPPLSDKPSTQRQLSRQEFEIVFKWLEMLFDFFHAVDEDSKEANGVPLEILRSPKYQDLKNLNFFYYESTDTLIKTSERLAVAAMNKQREAQARLTNRMSAPGTLSSGNSNTALTGPNGFGLTTMQRSKTVMHSRNLGTIKKVKEDRRKEAQAELSEDIILRILRMHPDAERYLRDRNRQKERLAATAAADMFRLQSQMQGLEREREIRRELAMAQGRRQ